MPNPHKPFEWNDKSKLQQEARAKCALSFHYWWNHYKQIYPEANREHFRAVWETAFQEGIKEVCFLFKTHWDLNCDNSE